MISHIGHIGILVKSVEKTLDTLSEFIEFERPEVKVNEKEGVKFTFVNIPHLGIELIEDVSEQGELRKIVMEKGDTIEHFCFVSDNIEKDVASLKERGIQMQGGIKPGLRKKKIIMTTEDAFYGMPVEISEP